MSGHEMAKEMAKEAMTRTNYGSGSLYKRASDGRWMGTLEAGFTASGARKRITVSGKTEAEVKRKLRDKRNELDREGRTNVKRTTSVARWAETWLEMIQPRIRPSAYETDRAAVRAIVAAIGATKLSDMTPTDVRAVAAYLRSNGKSTSTALRYHGSLIRMLKAASLDGYGIPPNVLLADPPIAAVHDRQAIPFDETVRLLGHISALPAGSRWSLAFIQGIRQAEALGLTWDQVDLDRGFLAVSWQLKSLRYRDKANPSAGFLMPDGFESRHLVGATHLVRPKSKAGWRIIPLVPYANNALRAWRESAPESPLGLVWPGNERKGQAWPRNAANDRQEWHDIQTACKVAHPSGRPYTVHEIRNTTATVLMEMGVAESVRIAIMGHSNITTTRGYEHVDQSQSLLALEKVATRLGLT